MINEYLEIGTNHISYKYKQDTPHQLTNGKTMKREKFIPKEIIDEDVPAFMGAVAQAAKDGKKEFEFGGKTYKVTLNKKVADKITKNMDEAKDGKIILKTHSASAAERLKKKLTNKFFDRRDQFIVKGSDLHIPNVSNIVRIAKKQPEIKESTDLEEVDDTELDKKSLDAMIKNPDPKRAKEYGGKAAYVKMLMKKRKNLGEEKGVKEDVEALQEADGWIAIFNGKKLEITKKDAGSLYAAKLFAIKKLKVPKSKQGLLAIKPAYNESVELEESTELYNDSGVIINQYSAGAGKMGYQITVGRKYIQLNKKELIKVLQGLGIEGVRGQLRKGGVIKESNVAELEEALKCPPAASNVELNTKNRDATIKKYMYGPLNVKEPGDYWEKVAKKWDTSVEAAKKSLCENCVAFDISPRMKNCMPGKTSDDEGELGYCWMHHFKCHSARTCTTWAKGGPIKDDKTSEEWQNKSMNESTDLQEATLPFKELEKAWIRTKGNEKAREKLVKKHNLKPMISNVRPGAIKLGPLNDLKAKTGNHTMAGLDADGELIFVTNNPVKIHYPSNIKDRPRGEELKEDVSIETQRLRRVVQLSLNESDITRIDDFIVEANIELNMTPSKIQSAYKEYMTEHNSYIA